MVRNSFLKSTTLALSMIVDVIEEPLTRITLLYGPAGSGKSTACLQAIRGKCAYIATTHNFSLERLRAMRPDADTLVEQIALFTPHDIIELERSIEQAVRLSRSMKLLIIDSLGTYLRVAHRRESNLALERILEKLSRATCPVLVVSDALDKPSRAKELAFVGGDLLRLHARTIIELQGGKATIKKHPVLAGRVWEYTITAAGLLKK